MKNVWLRTQQGPHADQRGLSILGLEDISSKLYSLVDFAGSSRAQVLGLTHLQISAHRWRLLLAVESVVGDLGDLCGAGRSFRIARRVAGFLAQGVDGSFVLRNSGQRFL